VFRTEASRTMRVSDKDLRGAHGSGGLVTQRRSGEIEVRLLARHVVVPIRQVAISRIGAQFVAERAVTDAIHVEVAILALQQSPRHAFAGQLLDHLGVVRSDPGFGRAGMRRPSIQPSLQFGVDQHRVRWPGQPGGGKTLDDALYGGTHHAQTARESDAWEVSIGPRKPRGKIRKDGPPQPERRTGIP
jgi:hypothetical protein